MMAFKNSSIKKNSYLVQIAKKKLEIHGIPSKQFLRNLDEISRSIRNKGNTFSASLFASAETRYRETSVGIKFISRQQRKIPTYISNRKIKLVYPFYISFFALFFSYRKIDIYMYIAWLKIIQIHDIIYRNCIPYYYQNSLKEIKIYESRKFVLENRFI